MCVFDTVIVRFADALLITNRTKDKFFFYQALSFFFRDQN